MNEEVKDSIISGEQYWEGKQNLLIRLWVYAQKGIAVINDFKYYGAFIIWLYYAMKFPSLLYIPAVGILTFPILIVIGRYYLHRVSKTNEYVNTIFGTILGYKGYEIQVETMGLLKQILSKLSNKGEV